jgi:hypothetical protein
LGEFLAQGGQIGRGEFFNRAVRCQFDFHDILLPEMFSTQSVSPNSLEQPWCRPT